MKSKRRIFTLQQVLRKVYTCSFVHVNKINSIGNKEMEEYMLLEKLDREV